LILAGLIIAGCGGSKEVKEDDGATLEEFVAKSEKNFQPSKYDDDIEKIKNADSSANTVAPEEKILPKASIDTVSGYRVQVLFTADIEHANMVKDSLSTLLPNEYVYLVYDSPNYKVRIGNYVSHADADAMVKRIAGLGYPDAWVVPDNIFLNLPLK
jgi:cell division protein FtsN